MKKKEKASEVFCTAGVIIFFVSELNNEYVTREMFKTVFWGKDVIHETKRFIATLPEEKQANVANMHRKFCVVRTKGLRDMLADRHTRTHTLIQYSAPQTAGGVNYIPHGCLH